MRKGSRGEKLGANTNVGFFSNETLLEEISCTMMVFLPRGKGGYRVIGIV